MNKHWQPFFALENNKDELEEVCKQQNNVEAKVLSEEDLAVIEANLLTSYNEQVPIEITLIKNGQVQYVNGIVSKLDPINKQITVNKQQIEVNPIIDVQIKNIDD